MTTFTPVIGLESDSSYWHPVGDLDNIVSTSDLGVVGVSDDANYVDLMFPDPGTFEFGYVVTNNFGCTWDTTLTVEVVENPGTIITAGPDQIFCSEPIQLLGGLTLESLLRAEWPVRLTTATEPTTTPSSATVRTRQATAL